MCGCERHWNPAAPCGCECDHKEDKYIAATDIAAEDAVAIVGVSQEGYLVGTIKQPRLKRYVYKHAHKCSLQNEFFTYRPATTGPVMFPIHPVCIETETQLMLVRIEEC